VAELQYEPPFTQLTAKRDALTSDDNHFTGPPVIAVRDGRARPGRYPHGAAAA
jgi:hypothetical protein